MDEGDAHVMAVGFDCQQSQQSSARHTTKVIKGIIVGVSIASPVNQIDQAMDLDNGGGWTGPPES
jgi:hypothetical protein